MQPKSYEIFEWVVCVGSQKYYLTENQYETLMSQQKIRLVQFRDFVINPAYITSIFKRPVEELVKMYPCPKCDGSKMYATTIDGERRAVKCDVCKETGVDIKLLGYEK